MTHHVDEARTREEVERASAAQDAADQAAKILTEVLPLSTSDHAIGWALLAVYHELRLARVGVADELGKIRSALQTTADVAESSAPRRGRGSW